VTTTFDGPGTLRIRSIRSNYEPATCTGRRRGWSTEQTWISVALHEPVTPWGWVTDRPGR
jgi:hypothetical protein